jgi:hypothetical protein
MGRSAAAGVGGASRRGALPGRALRLLTCERAERMAGADFEQNLIGPIERAQPIGEAHRLA